MSENSTLRIHTQLPPDVPAMPVVVNKRARKARARREKVHAQVVANAAESRREKLHAQAEARAEASRREKPHAQPKVSRRGGFTDRLLRNSAIACALLLGVLALGNIRQPWAQKARKGIERALTMRIDLDDSLGELTFVRSLMPESALVFLNVSGGAAMARPTDGAVTHPWSALQPWTMFDSNGEEAHAAGAGTVTAVSPLSDGRFGIMIDHGEGVESVYAALKEVSVASGDAVSRGDALGVCDGELYFEVRERGESVDPAERLGL